MALNINTNITNNLDGYLLDAKNVKGGFVVVEDWSEVSDLPSSTKVTGSLIYVVGDTLGGGANVGFYQYDAIGNWQKRVLGGSGIYQFASQSANNIDYSQTYTYTLTSSQQTQIGSDFARLVDADTTTLPMLIFAFNDTNLLIAMSNLAMGTSGILSHTIIEQNNTQYIVNISIASDFSTITLSFSELQAGSGGGTSTVQLKSYLSHVILEYDWTTKAQQDNPDITSATNTFDLQFNVLPKQAEKAIQLVSQMTGATITNWTELLAVVKATIESGANTYARTTTLCLLLNVLISSGITLELRNSYYDSSMAEPREFTVPYRLAYEYGLSGIQFVESYVNNSAIWKTIGYNDYSLMNPTIRTSYTEEVYDEFTVSGGSSEGSGSGKLYEWYFALERYDENGDVVQYGYNPSPTDDNLYLHVLVYESNWERFKVNAQSMGITLSQPSDLTSLINTTFNENVGTTASNIYGLLGHLIMQSDKTLLIIGTAETEVFFDAMGLMATFLSNQIIPLMTDAGGTDIYYGLNVNNSCTLTEYGTSGGGGGASATRTKYHIEVEDSNGNKAIIPIYQDTFEDYLVEFNQVGQTMATAMGITWTTLNNIAEFKTLFDTQKSTQLAYGCDLAMNLLVKYAYESGENPTISGSSYGINILEAVNSIYGYNLQNNYLGAVNSFDYDDSYVNNYPVTENGSPTSYEVEINGKGNNVLWFKNNPTSISEEIIIDTNATFTYTEEQVAGGGSGGSGTSDVLYKHSVALDVIDGDNNSVSATFEFLSKHSTPFVTNGSLADMLTSLVATNDSENIINPLCNIDNTWVIVSQIWPDVPNYRVRFNFVNNGFVFVLDANFSDNTNITDTVTPYIQVSGGGGSGTGGTGIDYMQVELPNGWLYLTFAKGCFEGQFATDLNSAIATINTAYGTSIPNFESIESWKTIYDYLTGLGSSYVALAVMWLSVFFYNGCYFALSQKCMYNGEFCPVSIEAIADMQNQSFSYAIKYLSANSSPLAFAEATSSSNYVQLEFNINELV